MNRFRHGFLLCALLCLTAWRADALSSPLSGALVPDAVHRLAPIGRPDAGTRLRLAISLPMRDTAAWNAFVQSVSDPASPNYRHFLTPAQITERYGPTAADYQSVIDFSRAHGLAVAGLHANRLLVDVEGSVADVEKTFHTSIQLFRHPTEDRSFYAPTVEPSWDLATPILRVTGLDDYSRPRSLVRQSAPRAGAAPRAGSGPDGNYLGADFRDAYVPGVAQRGEGQSIALVEFDGYFTSDVRAYEALAGMTNIPLENVLIDGFNGLPYSGGEIEVTLDIDMVVAMAPGLAQVFVYEATNGADSTTLDELNRIATDDSARQISCSWGLDDNPAFAVIYQTYAAQGQSFFQASGDSGAFVPFTNSIDSDNPYATLVGGTTLLTDPGGSYASEQVWNWNSSGQGADASGGGFSTNFALPVWQEGFANSTNLASGQYRDCPDVALTADNIYIIQNNGQAGPGTGGTSAAAPLWAAFMSLVNEQAKAGGLAPIGFANPILYSLARTAKYETLFHDIKVGNNTNIAGGPIDYPAVTGYDLATGLGTPTPALLNALAPVGAPVLLPVSSVLSGGNGNGLIDPDECNDLTVTITNVGSVRATGVEGVLVSESYPQISLGQSVVSFPDVPPFSSATAEIPFTISSSPDFACGSTVSLSLTLKSDQGVSSAPIILSSGTPGSPVDFAANPAQPISIPINTTGASSTLKVSDISSIAHVSVSVDIPAIYDSGLTLELISPGGVSVTLASGDGGLGANFGSGCGVGQATTFDDDADVPLSSSAPPFVGSFTPDQPLASFNLLDGSQANGTWTLLAIDNFAGDTAQINCWSLAITPFVCSPGSGACSGADLSITQTAAPNPVIVTSNFTCLLVASNAGPSVASNIVVQESFSPGVGFVGSKNVSQGVVSATADGASWSINSLPVGGTATASIVSLSGVPDTTATATASISSATPDPNLANNTATATVSVEPPGADLAVSITAAPNPALEDGRITYTILVTNNGPYAAQSVALATLVPNVNYISASTSQGAISSSGAQIALGSVPSGGGAVIQLVVSPTTTGDITAVATVSLSLSEIDPVPQNNTASVTTTVVPSADLGVFATESPNPSVAGSNLVYVATFTNRGPAAATDVILAQLFPVGSQLVSTSLSGPNVQTNAGSLIWDIGSLPSGAGGSFMTTLVSPTNVGPDAPPVISTFTISGQPADPNTNDNVAVVTTINSNAFLKVIAAGATLLGGNVINPNTTVSVSFALQNAGNIPTADLTATLVSSNGVTFPEPAAGVLYGNSGVLLPGATATNVFTFAAVGTNGGTITALLDLRDGATDLGVASFVFHLPVISTFWNTGFISIPDQRFIPNPDSGPANPYPSSVVVSNVSGIVSEVSVTLSNMSHSFPHDVSMLLVSPAGVGSILMSSAAFDSEMTNVTFTITPDPSAPALPASGAIVAASYQPADYDASVVFPAPAPPGPYAPLSSFSGDGTNFNGPWSLYVFDTTDGDAGNVANGWGLSVKTIIPVNQIADLGVFASVSNDQVVIDGSNMFSVTVTNAGPNAADAAFNFVLPAGLAFVSATLPSGSFTATGQGIASDLGALPPGASMAFKITVVAVAGGLQTASFGVAPANPTVFDPNGVNNSTDASMTVLEPVADLVALSTSPPAPVVVGQNQLYTLTVSNAGPQLALGVTGQFNLNGLGFVSGSASQGSTATSGGSVFFGFGNIPAGAIETAQVVAVPQSSGWLTNSWSVASASTDPSLANNTNLVPVDVRVPAPVIIAGPAFMLTPGASVGLPPGQPVTVSLVLSNIGYASTTNLSAVLLGTNGITPLTASATYGAIAAGSSVGEPFTFAASGPPGATVDAILQLTDGTNSYPSVFFPFVLPNAFSVSNSAAIIIPNVGVASPYPSSILIATNGVVSNATVTLRGFTHSFPRDVNVLLAAPTGQSALLFAHAGGPYSATNLTFTFDDAATNSLPETSLSSGVFLPTSDPPDDIFPGFSAPPYGTNLAVFAGLNPSGAWSLYVYDDAAGNDGVISQGWALNLSLVSPIPPLPAPPIAAQWQAALAGNVIELTLFGSAGATYVVQESPDLVSWSVVSTNVIGPSGAFTITDNAANAARRFFRAVLAAP